jgi:phage terminase large subunit-like protein
MRHKADVIVGETNFGGGMVKSTIQVAAKALETRVPFKMVTASRGKVQRAEPFSAMYDDGKVRHVGIFAKLEDELCAFSTGGYTGPRSPNRADAHIWALAELFPAMVRPPVDDTPVEPIPMVNHYGRR